MSPTRIGALTPYLSRSVRDNPSARSRLLLHPMTGIPPRAAMASATVAPNPPEPPARTMTFPFISSLHPNAADKPFIDSLAREGLHFFTQLRPPSFRKRCNRIRDVHLRQDKSGRKKAFEFSGCQG